MPAVVAVPVTNGVKSFNWSFFGQQSHIYYDLTMKACAATSVATTDPVLVHVTINRNYVQK